MTTWKYNHSTITTSFCQSHMFFKFSDKMAYANSVDPNQTAPSGAVWLGSTLFAIQQSILRNSCIKAKVFQKKVWKVFEILGHLLYSIFNIKTTHL